MEDNSSLDIAENIQWGTAEEKIMKDLGDKSIIYSTLSAIAYDKYNKLGIIFNIIIALITGIVGLLSFMSDKIPSSFTYYSIIVGSISFMATALSSVTGIMKLNDKTSNFRYMENQFKHLSRDIDITLNLKRISRPNFKLFLEKCRNHYHKLMEGMNDITNTEIMELEKTMNINGLTLPNTLKGIVVNTDDDEDLSRRRRTLPENV